MVVRMSAAICGVVIVFACSFAANARSEISTLHSYAAATIVGTASMYNPFQPGYQEGGIETASGELYDPSEWTAAIRTDLRDMFGGVRLGKRIRYALIEGDDKKAIVKINDVGPLKPGRIIDFNEQTMRYFDPTLQRGLIDNVKVTPLDGDDWTPGPVAER
jgi:peptidoglycan lytic transglycosylase